MPALHVGATKVLRVRDKKSGAVSDLKADVVINAAGLHAQEVARTLKGLPPERIPKRYLARGCYFKLKGARVATCPAEPCRSAHVRCVQLYFATCM